MNTNRGHCMEEKQRLSLPDLLLKPLINYTWNPKDFLFWLERAVWPFLRGLKSLKQKTYITDIQTKLNQDYFHTSGNPLLLCTEKDIRKSPPHHIIMQWNKNIIPTLRCQMSCHPLGWLPNHEPSIWCQTWIPKVWIEMGSGEQGLPYLEVLETGCNWLYVGL